MPISIQEIAAGVVVPWLVSSMILGGWCQFGKRNAPRRQAAAVALAAGFCTALALLPWTPVLPKEHWHWLFYLAIMATIVGATSVADGIGWLERHALYGVIAAVAAWFLVPDWKSIEPVRHWHLLLVAAGIFLLCAALEPLARSQRGTSLSLAWLATSLAGSIVLLLSGSLKFAQLGGAVVFSELGCLLVALLWPRRVSFRGAVPAFAVVLGGLMYIGRIHSFSEVPLASYLLVTAAPLGLWFATLGPLANRSKAWQVAARVLLVLLPLALAVGLAAWAE